MKKKTAIYILVAALLFAAIAAGCAADHYPSFAEWTSTLTLEDLSHERTNLYNYKIYGGDQIEAVLTDEQKEELLEIFHSITEDDCHTDLLSDAEAEYGYSLYIYRDNKIWLFKCLESGMVGVMFHSEEEKNYYGNLKDSFLNIDSPALYAFIRDTVDTCGKAGGNYGQPVTVEEYARRFVRQTLDGLVEKHMGESNTHFHAYDEAPVLFKSVEINEDMAVEFYELDYLLTIHTYLNEIIWEEQINNCLVMLRRDTGDGQRVYDQLVVTDVPSILTTYGTPEMVETYGDIYTAAANGFLERFGQEFIVEEEEPVLGPENPGDIMESLLAGSRVLYLTLYTEADGQCRTVSLDVDSADVSQFDNLLSGRGFEKYDVLPVSSGDYSLTLTSEDGERTMTIWSGSDQIYYSSADYFAYWLPAAHDENDYAGQLAQTYLWLEGHYNQVTVSADTPRQAVERFAQAYGEMLKSLSSRNDAKITDYAVLTSSVRVTSLDDDAVLGTMEYALIPANDSGYFWAGNTTEGAGEYEGWLCMGREFVLELQEDGLWHCTGFGTGGYFLSQYGYKTGADVESPGDAFAAMYEKGDVLYMSLDEGLSASKVAAMYTADSSDAWFADEIGNLLYKRSFVELDSRPAVQYGGYCITIGSEDGLQGMRFWSGAEGLVSYTFDGVTRYWVIEGEPSLAGKLKEYHSGLLDNVNQITLSANSPQEAVEVFTQALGSLYLNLPSGHIHRMTDYAVVEWDVLEVSTDGRAAIGEVRYAFIPEGDMNNFAAGNLWEGEGEYEGWGIKYAQFFLELQPDGLWRCRGMGTGGYTLLGTGYKAVGQVDLDGDVLGYFQDLLTGNWWYNAAMGSIYDSPEQMDLNLVFYGGFPDRELHDNLTAEEREYLNSRGFYSHLSVQKMPAERLNEVLTEYFGVTLSDVQIPDEWVYYEATDSYYSNHSDAYRVHGFHVTKVDYPDISVFRVYYTVEPMRGAFDPVTGEPVTEAVLTLCGKAGGGFMVLSNRVLSGETESGYDSPLSQLAFDHLDLNAWPGIGFNLCYESESLIVFYGEQGLFGYDPEQGNLVFEVDFIKAFGKKGIIQGSHGTGVSVDADGENLILSFRDPDDQEVYFIHIPSLTYRQGRYLPMEDVFPAESAEGYVMPYGRLGDTVYVRGDQRWAVFEGYGESR